MVSTQIITFRNITEVFLFSKFFKKEILKAEIHIYHLLATAGAVQSLTGCLWPSARSGLSSGSQDRGIQTWKHGGGNKVSVLHRGGVERLAPELPYSVGPPWVEVLW